MADLDRYDLDDQYAGECPICGETMYDYDEMEKVAGEMVHLACAEEVEDDLNALNMNWGPESE